MNLFPNDEDNDNKYNDKKTMTSTMTTGTTINNEQRPRCAKKTWSPMQGSLGCFEVATHTVINLFPNDEDNDDDDDEHHDDNKYNDKKTMTTTMTSGTAINNEQRPRCAKKNVEPDAGPPRGL